MKYFKESEFECDGVNCFQEMDSNLLVMLEEARNISETPLMFTLNRLSVSRKTEPTPGIVKGQEV